MVGLAFAIAASANFPALVLSLSWPNFTTRGAVASMLIGNLSCIVLIALSPTVLVDILGSSIALFPLKNPAIISVPLSVVSGVLVSLFWPEPAGRTRYLALEERMLFGAGASDEARK
jgi:cation/acetate symporter